MLRKGFTLAEVLITLAIIGVVAALTIPSVVANTQQQEFKTGLRKAVSVLNSSITMNMAIDGESPYDNADLYRYLGRHMSVMKSMALSPMPSANTWNAGNVAFYTTDGMRFEFNEDGTTYSANLKLHENPNIRLRGALFSYSGDQSKGIVTSINAGGSGVYCNTFADYDAFGHYRCSHCGSYGLNNNTDNTIQSPCLVVVDVNGDRKPFPKNASCFNSTCGAQNVRKFSDPMGKKLTDSFAIMITDKQAIPYGVAAQKAMYEAQK